MSNGWVTRLKLNARLFLFTTPWMHIVTAQALNFLDLFLKSFPCTGEAWSGKSGNPPWRHWGVQRDVKPCPAQCMSIRVAFQWTLSNVWASKRLEKLCQPCIWLQFLNSKPVVTMITDFCWPRYNGELLKTVLHHCKLNFVCDIHELHVS